MDSLCAYPPEARPATSTRQGLEDRRAEGAAASDAYREGCQTEEVSPDAIASMVTGSLVLRQTAGCAASDLEQRFLRTNLERVFYQSETKQNTRTQGWTLCRGDRVIARRQLPLKDLSRMSGNLSCPVLRGERSRKAPDLPG